jgi:hypothetical protein
MHVGEKDGLGEVYKGDGSLILNEDEKILTIDENFMPTLRTTWGYFGGTDLMEPAKGTAYLTNQRFVFIVMFEAIMKIKPGEGTATGPQSYAMKLDSVTDMQKLNAGSGVREYFEIPIKEIIACEIKEGVVSSGLHINAYLLSKGEQFHLSFVTPPGSELHRRFKQNQVQNVDQLTKNLKDHFENTKWIYLEEDENSV